MRDAELKIGQRVYDIPFGVYATIVAIEYEPELDHFSYELDESVPLCENYPDRWRSLGELTTTTIYPVDRPASIELDYSRNN